VVCRLDRLGRNLRHLILLLDELTALGVAFVSLNEGIDTSTPAGRLQLHLLGAISQFERKRIQERVCAGLARAKAHGRRLGRPRVRPLAANAPTGLSVRQAAVLWGVSKSTAARRLISGTPFTQVNSEPQVDHPGRGEPPARVSSRPAAALDARRMGRLHRS
jgi:DNA invertase Pin-like site-specific DNA recombinase